ncbi:MAG: hypothetical protein IPK22_20400 [Verrucomicrobiaceae bacterium]|nr:hypothetical protein [Verrucomicrobiaceae bacterium]
MIPNPIHKVLSTFQNCKVRALLMGGQACVFYGGAEFSRDTDFAILADETNLTHLRSAIHALQAEVIAVPPFSMQHLLDGHAVHFRCQHPEAKGMRVDVMARMRGVADFHALWERRTTLEGADGTIYDLMSLPDLVQAKKTQRDKDWPMIRRLIEADHAACQNAPTSSQVRFWLAEARTPELLIELAHQYREEVQSVSSRPAVAAALLGHESQVQTALEDEERAERLADKAYWEPLKRELEQLRRASH